MITLITIPAGHMRFVPAHKQTNETNTALSPAKWPVEFVLIANHKGRESFMDSDRIHNIMAPAIKGTCRLPSETTPFFSPHPFPHNSTAAQMRNVRLPPYLSALLHRP